MSAASLIDTIISSIRLFCGSLYRIRDRHSIIIIDMERVVGGSNI